jgi:hypothetical protein
MAPNLAWVWLTRLVERGTIRPTRQERREGIIRLEQEISDHEGRGRDSGHSLGFFHLTTSAVTGATDRHCLRTNDSQILYLLAASVVVVAVQVVAIGPMHSIHDAWSSEPWPVASTAGTVDIGPEVPDAWLVPGSAPSAKILILRCRPCGSD